MSEGEKGPPKSWAELMAAYDALKRHVPLGEPTPVLVGGAAMQLYGSPRMTSDLDVMATSVCGFSGAPLSFGGIRTSVEGVPTDIIIRDDEYAHVYQEALAYAVTRKGLAVISPEYLAITKLIAGLTAGRWQDEFDLRYLVTTKGLTSIRKLRRLTRRLLGAYAADDLDSKIEESRWKERLVRKSK